MSIYICIYRNIYIHIYGFVWWLYKCALLLRAGYLLSLCVRVCVCLSVCLSSWDEDISEHIFRKVK